jgi:hypothetical protein
MGVFSERGDPVGRHHGGHADRRCRGPAAGGGHAVVTRGERIAAIGSGIAMPNDALDADPLIDIRNVKQIGDVVIRGKLVLNACCGVA